MKVWQITGMVEADGWELVRTRGSHVAHMREAIAFHLEGLAADGDPIPEPSGPGVYIARDPPAA